MEIPDIDTITTPDQARELAMDWQSWQYDHSLYMSEAADWCDFFKQLADKFNDDELTEEFTENAII